MFRFKTPLEKQQDQLALQAKQLLTLEAYFNKELQQANARQKEIHKETAQKLASLRGKQDTVNQIDPAPRVPVDRRHLIKDADISANVSMYLTAKQHAEYSKKVEKGKDDASVELKSKSVDVSIQAPNATLSLGLPPVMAPVAAAAAAAAVAAAAIAAERASSEKVVVAEKVSEKIAAQQAVSEKATANKVAETKTKEDHAADLTRFTQLLSDTAHDNALLYNRLNKLQPGVAPAVKDVDVKMQLQKRAEAIAALNKQIRDTAKATQEKITALHARAVIAANGKALAYNLRDTFSIAAKTLQKLPAEKHVEKAEKTSVRAPNEELDTMVALLKDLDEDRLRVLNEKLQRDLNVLENLRATMDADPAMKKANTAAFDNSRNLTASVDARRKASGQSSIAKQFADNQAAAKINYTAKEAQERAQRRVNASHERFAEQEKARQQERTNFEHSLARHPTYNLARDTLNVLFKNGHRNRPVLSVSIQAGMQAKADSSSGVDEEHTPVIPTLSRSSSR
jgi:hypothetical protein